MSDLIDRQTAIDAFRDTVDLMPECYARDIIAELPSAQLNNSNQEVKNSNDVISRQVAIDAISNMMDIDGFRDGWAVSRANVDSMLRSLPSAQPQRTCVNCGRTANNGGWYADGRTRCPIEEHYALPKDGYCHLWEKRNVTDDDYPERREA